MPLPCTLITGEGLREGRVGEGGREDVSGREKGRETEGLRGRREGVECGVGKDRDQRGGEGNGRGPSRSFMRSLTSY